jgi:hypothetical protein
VTSNASQGEQEPQWQQPSFQPGKEPGPAPSEPVVASGSLIVPFAAVPPPSAIETTVRTISGLVWPVMIVLAIMGGIDFWPAILIAIVTSTVLGNVSRHLKAQRKDVARTRRITPGDPGRMR